jgi:hypothetical protein
MVLAFTKECDVAYTGIGSSGYNVVSIDLPYLIVGDYHDSSSKGAIYVSERTGLATFVDRGKLLASDGAALDRFGYTANLYDDRILVGAPYHATGGITAKGQVYSFDRSGTAWGSGGFENQKFCGSDVNNYEYFGSRVCQYGNWAAVTSFYNWNAGAVYIFEFTGGIWVERQKIISPNTAIYSYFGYDLGMYEDRLIIGEYSHDGWNYHGKAYVYKRSGSSYSLEDELLPVPDLAAQQYGWSVAIDNDLAVVMGKGSGSSAVNNFVLYIYRLTGSSWSLEKYINPVADGWPYITVGNYGGDESRCVSADSSINCIVVGSRYSDVGATPGWFNEGAIYILGKSSGDWDCEQSIAGSQNAQGLGIHVDMKDYSLVVGSFGISPTDYVSIWNTTPPVPPTTPFLANPSPIDTATGIDGYTLFSVDILSENTINFIDAYVNDFLAFSDSVFYSPYDGPSSSLLPTSFGGYDGYRLTLDRTTLYPASTLETVRVISTDITGGTALDDSYSFRTGTGISSVEYGTYEITLDVTFSNPVLNDGYLVSSANYNFDHGMYARYVERLTDTKVRLWVEKYQDETEFTLSVYNVIDSYGDNLPTSYNYKTFSPFYSIANLGSYNGKIRTWRESNCISSDSKRIYLAGSKGIDVFKKLSGEITSRWSCALTDGYAVNTMFLAHFGGDHNFTGGYSYIKYANPAAESEAPIETPISFVLEDATTAIDIQDLSVYINGVLIFLGISGGWKNGYSGFIIYGTKSLYVYLIPPEYFKDGDVVNVNIVAKNLLGNTLNTSYDFYVVDTDGFFGFGSFGFSSFGGIDLSMTEGSIFGDVIFDDVVFE